MGKQMERTAEWAVDTYGDMVYRLALTQMKNKSDAEDIFQEVFLRLVKNISKLQSEEHVKAWLIRVTLNCCKSHFMSFWNRNVQGFEEDQRDLEPAQESKEINDLLEEKDRVTVSVSHLPKKYRSVVYLFYYEEMSLEEIAQTTGLNVNTVKSRLFRARTMLKKELGDFEG
ncbi:MAG: RNA polymerase sigma factor [Lachnospiraceae bacterium]